MFISVVIITVINCILFYKRNTEMLEKECAVDQVVLESSLTTLYKNAENVCLELTEDSVFCNAIEKQDKDTLITTINSYRGNQEIFCVVTDTNKKVLCGTGVDATEINLDGISTGYITNTNKTTIYYVVVGDTGNGIVITGVDMSKNAILDNIKSLTGAEVTVFIDTKRLATTILDSAGERAVGTLMSDEVAAVVKEQVSEYKAVATIMDAKYQSTYYPITTTKGAYVGAIFVGTAMAEGEEATVQAAIQSLLVGIVVLVLAGVYMIYYIRTHVAAPVIVAKTLAEQMSEGDLKPIEITCKIPDDEVGHMVQTMTGTQGTLSAYIKDITDVLTAMADGDFTKEPTIEYVGEFKAIAKAFIGIRTKLTETLTQIQVTVDEVTADATQIATGAQILAEGATKQAASVEELSATISDVSEKIQHTAKNARESEACAVDANKNVVQQAQDMTAVHDAMADIREKSTQISTIIKSIEDLAFQTNILALNAAVEAARAGDAGKGFAVVADEVRNLASKSDAAAKETAKIINETLAAVTQGTTIVEGTVTTVNAVTETTQHVGTLVHTIADEAEEQKEAVIQVNAGITQISEVVQQNSATAEEFAASCEELNGQVELLKAQVERIKVGD